MTPPLPHRERVAWVDAAKGLGIIAVVYGHLIVGNEVRRWIYLFHMPLFFLLAGMFQRRVASAGGFLGFVKQKTGSRLVPYAIFSVISVAVWFGATSHLVSSGEAGSVTRILLPSILKGAPAVNTPLWFFVCLFATEIFAFPFLKLSKIPGLISAVLIVFCLLNPWISPELHPGIFKMGVALVSLPFLLIGFHARDLILSVGGRNVWGMFGVFVFFLAVTAVGSTLHEPVEIVCGAYGSLPGFYLYALSGTAMVIGLARVLQQAGSLCSIGRASAFIFALHFPLRLCVIVGLRMILRSPSRHANPGPVFAAVCTVILIGMLMGLERLWLKMKPRFISFIIPRKRGNSPEGAVPRVEA